MRLPASVLAIVAVVGAAPAQAATVRSVTPPCGLIQSKYAQCDPTTIAFTAAPGEANRLTVTNEYASTGDRAVVFRDEGARLETVEGCTRIDEHTARCGAYQALISVVLGDGDDRAVTSLVPVDGGTGDDVLGGSDGPDTLTGGPGRDRLLGGGGDDTLIDGDGRAPVADVVDGGPGTDRVSYSGRPDGVTVDLSAAATLAPPGSGAPGEGDEVLGVEQAHGGAGDDVLTGDGGPNRLEGGPGDDRLTGGDGPDQLDGGTGRDAFDAGAGDDRLLTTRSPFTGPGAERPGEDVRCGDGTDTLVVLRDVVAPDCEQLIESLSFSPFPVDGPTAYDGYFRPHPVARTARTWTFRTPCTRRYQHQGRCRGKVVLHDTGSGRLLGRGEARGRAPWVTVRVRLRRPAPRVVTVLQHARSACGRSNCIGYATMRYRLRTAPPAP